MKKISVLIADDHSLIRAGLRGLVEAHADLVVVGEVTTFPELWSCLESVRPDVVLLDLRMPGGAGLDAIGRLRQAHTAVRILVLSAYPEDAFLLRVVRAGAAGYLEKDGSLEQVAHAIRTVASGEMYVSEAGGRALARAARPGAASLDASVLSDREFEVLRLLGAGVTAGAIAEQLSISVKTVSTYRARIMKKMGFSSNADLIRYTLEHNLTQ
jgi:two-component system, NarL family, invasion response regulator UvrY